MKWLALSLIIISVFVLLTSCSASATKQIDALKPEPTDEKTVLYENKTSFVSLPVEVSLKDIEKQLNKNLDGLIYQDSILDDDDTEIKIWKSRAIELSEENGVILSEIPLKIWAKVRYGTQFLGLNDTKEIYMDGVLYLESSYHLTNWKLSTKSKIYDLRWNESPSIKVAGKLIPITYLITPTIRYFKQTIATQIDNAIDETCDFKPYVLDALETLSTPNLVHEEYETWFKLIPIELYVTDAKLENSIIKMNMGLKCTLQTMIGDEPKNTFDRNDIVLKPVSRMPDKVSLSLAAVSTYKSASKVITKNFKGEEFGSGNKKVTVQNVEIWEKDKKLIIALDLTGSINGTIYLTGYPNYNETTQEIYFDQLDYVLNTKSLLLKSANWLAQGTILRKIQENCRYSIKENLEEGETTLASYLDNYSPTKGVFINGAFTSIEFEKVELTDKAIIAFLTTSGKVNVKIDGLE